MRRLGERPRLGLAVKDGTITTSWALAVAGPEDDRTEGKRFHDALQLACAPQPSVFPVPGLIRRTGLTRDDAGGSCVLKARIRGQSTHDDFRS